MSEPRWHYCCDSSDVKYSIGATTDLHNLTLHIDVSVTNLFTFPGISPHYKLSDHIFEIFFSRQFVSSINTTVRFSFCLEMLNLFCNLISWWSWRLTWFSWISLTEEIKTNSWGIALHSQFVPNPQGACAAGQLITHPWFGTNSPHLLINLCFKSQPYQVSQSLLSRAVLLYCISLTQHVDVSFASLRIQALFVLFFSVSCFP